ncbi:MAG TPA: cob(I)yrinic acid a,c-diamide adenosyltransferase [Gammaproteobacteria bacterium]|nr:cob(I)yrinic acid a,c-diamide adenosyltransferase [Gammaproteobacteria bacterium]
MGNRLSKIYTRTGDKGTTQLGDGSRVAKDAPRIEAIGTVDELNSLLGMVLAERPPEPVAALLTAVQNDLFDLGGSLSIPGRQSVTARHVERLEKGLDGLNAELPPLQEFILPAGGRAAATCHLARAVCRRAERSLVGVSVTEEVDPQALAYLNRLSDLLFVCARVLARAESGEEVYWRPGAGAD